MTKLKINTMLCDCRNVSEEFLKQYDQIKIDSMMVFQNEASMELMSRYTVSYTHLDVYKRQTHRNTSMAGYGGPFGFLPI